MVTSSFPQTKNLEALIYGRQIRLAGASTACRLSLPDLTKFGGGLGEREAERSRPQ